MGRHWAVVLCVLMAACATGTGEVQTTSTTPRWTAPVEPLVQRVARLAFVGDLMLGRNVAPVVEGDPGSVFERLRPALVTADLAFGNLESPGAPSRCSGSMARAASTRPSAVAASLASARSSERSGPRRQRAGGDRGGRLGQQLHRPAQPNGALDRSFGTDGISTVPQDEETEFWNAAVVATGDRVVVAGGRGEGDFSDEITLTRFDDRGRPDTSYGTAGIVGIALNATSCPAAMVIDQLDRTTIVGVSDGQFFVTRVDQNGRLDTNFGSRGMTLIPFGGPRPDGATSIVADAGGHSVVAGYAFGTTYTFALARLSS